MNADLHRKRVAAGRIGGLVTASRYDVRERTKAATAAFLSRFDHEVDPDLVLPPEERTRRATAAKRAHFQRLARKSANARSRKKATGGPPVTTPNELAASLTTADSHDPADSVI